MGEIAPRQLPAAAEFIADGKTVAVGTAAGAVRLFDTATGTPGAVLRLEKAAIARVPPRTARRTWDVTTGAKRYRRPHTLRRDRRAAVA
ncbi:MAG TPA: hypothetical protein VH092_37530 [Urbifossiella sp.]|nr:hypothetical protein [Urbifossiella sp.]